MHKLHVEGFIDPRLMAAMSSVPYREAQARDQQSVEVAGHVLTLEHSEDIRLEPGQKVYITLGRDFYLETEEERAEREQAVKVQQAIERGNRHCRLNQLRSEAEAFNATLHLPVRWEVGMKDVLSGLTANSMGDGCNAASVDHIRLLEDLRDGRFHRTSGDFLCTSQSGSNGKAWTGNRKSIAYDGDGNTYQPKVTCKTCLRLARRWNG